MFIFLSEERLNILRCTSRFDYISDIFGLYKKKGMVTFIVNVFVFVSHIKILNKVRGFKVDFIYRCVMLSNLPLNARFVLEHISINLGLPCRFSNLQKWRRAVIKKPITFKIYLAFGSPQNDKEPHVEVHFESHCLKDITNVKNIGEQLEHCLGKIHKSELPGKFKAWCYQHGVVPRIRWPLMMYEVPMSAVEKMESKISSRKWLGIPPSFTNIGLYGRDTKLQLPFTALTEVSKARMAITIETSRDECVCKAGVTLPTGRKMGSKNCGKRRYIPKHKARCA